MINFVGSDDEQIEMPLRELVLLLPIEKMTPLLVVPGRTDITNVQSFPFKKLYIVKGLEDESPADHPVLIGWAAEFAPSGPSTGSSVMSPLLLLPIVVSESGSTGTKSLPQNTLLPDEKS